MMGQLLAWIISFIDPIFEVALAVIFYPFQRAWDAVGGFGVDLSSPPQFLIDMFACVKGVVGLWCTSSIFFGCLELIILTELLLAVRKVLLWALQQLIHVIAAIL
jgi:hypothetical protein